MSRPILIVFNPVAGPGRRRRLERSLAVLRAKGIAADLHETRWPRDAMEVAAAAAGYGMVVAAGGDGTINEVINGLMRRAEVGQGMPPLGILPFGTANVLAAELGLPTDPEAAAAVLVGGEPERIHLGVANGRYFALMAGVGFDAYVVQHIKLELKRYLGKGAYAWEMLGRLIAYPPGLYRVAIDGRETTAASVVVAKSHFYGGRFVLAPEASPTRPDLQVCLFKTPGRGAALRYMAAMALGRLPRLDDYSVVRTTSLRIDGAADAPVQADGDIAAVLPLEVSVSPVALPVVLDCGRSGTHRSGT